MVLSGPSGSGKTTIAREVEQRLGGRFSVSATTRPRSEAEETGRDYEFLSEPEFRDLVERGALLEYAQVYGMHWYGTPREPVERDLADGQLVILDIDVQGGIQVKKALPEALLIFITPPNDEDLQRRLRARGRDDDASMHRRLAEARSEMQVGLHSGAYDAQVVNEDIEQAIEETCRLVRQQLADDEQ